MRNDSPTQAKELRKELARLVAADQTPAHLGGACAVPYTRPAGGDVPKTRALGSPSSPSSSQGSQGSHSPSSFGTDTPTTSLPRRKSYGVRALSAYDSPATKGRASAQGGARSASTDGLRARTVSLHSYSSP